MDSDVQAYIDREIQRQMDVLLSGKSGGSTIQNGDFKEDIQEMYPGLTTITTRPVIHPFGFVSRAAAGVLQVVGKMGEHIGNRFVVGHRDKDRPQNLNVGESVVYSSGKYQVRVLNNAIQVGKNGTYQTVVMGEALRDLLKALIDLYAAHTHISADPGNPTEPPDNESDATQLKTDNLDNDKILAKDGGAF